MGRPTEYTRGILMTGPNMPAASLPGRALMTSSIGLTQTPTALKRFLTIVPLGASPAKAQSYTIFRGPTPGATITSIALSPGTGTAQPNTVPRTKNWVFSVVNKRTGLSLNKNACSFGGVGFATLAATAWKTIPVNNGNSTVRAGETLWIQFTVSSTPVTLRNPTVAVEWTPLTNV